MEMENSKRTKPVGAGRSSFGLIDADKVLGELQLKKGSTFVDLGCGRGEYAIAFAEIVGLEGLVYAIDLWEEGIASLSEEISDRGLKNLIPMVADVAKRVPLEDNSVDVCFMASVFHDLVLTNVAEGALEEVVRVLQRDGFLVVLEFKKIDGPPGPPLSSRLAPEEVERKVTRYGFAKERLMETGPYTYLITFQLQGKA
jgi:ubiquinone/menaquinone biosynthesis C-methylase UbiE